MWLIEAFVHNPVKVAVGVLLVALFGFIALMRMPMQLTPEVQIPTITIETRVHDKVVVVPQEVIIENQSGRSVFVERDGVATMRPVTLGAREGTRVEVLEGLATGDHIIVEGHRLLAEGQNVRVVDGP